MCGETTLSGVGMSEMISGFTSANAPFQQRWKDLYQYIRDANIFLERVNPKGNINDQYQLTEADVKRMKAEKIPYRLQLFLTLRTVWQFGSYPG